AGICRVHHIHRITKTKGQIESQPTLGCGRLADDELSQIQCKLSIRSFESSETRDLGCFCGSSKITSRHAWYYGAGMIEVIAKKAIDKARDIQRAHDGGQIWWRSC